MGNKIAGASIRVVKPTFQPGQATSHIPKPKGGDTFVKASSDASLAVEKNRVQGSFEMDTQGAGSVSFQNELRLRAASDTSSTSESEPSDHSGLQDRLDNATERFGLKREMEVDVHLGNETIGLDVEGRASIAANGVEAQGSVEARAGVGVEMDAHLNIGIAEAKAAANASAIAIAKADGSLKADLTGVNAEFSGEARAGVSAEAEGSFKTKSVTIGEKEYRIAIDGEARASAEASIEGKGKLNARLNTKDILGSTVEFQLEGSAMAGAQVEAKGAVELGPIKISGGARGHAGVGVGAQLSVGLSDGVLHARVGLDGSFGLGLGGEFDASIDLDEIRETAQEAGENLLEEAGVNVEAVKRNATAAHGILKDVTSGTALDTKEVGGAIDTLVEDVGIQTTFDFTRLGTETESGQKIVTELQEGKDLDTAATGGTVQGFLEGSGIKSNIDFSKAGKDVKTFQDMLGKVKEGKMLDTAKAGKTAESLLGQLGVEVPIELEEAGAHFHVLQQAVTDIQGQKIPDISKIGATAQGLIEMAGIKTPVNFGSLSSHIAGLQKTLTSAKGASDLDAAQLGSALQGVLKEMGIKTPVDFANMGTNSQTIKTMVQKAQEGAVFSAEQIGGALQSMLQETGIESPYDISFIGKHFDTFIGMVRDIQAGEMPDAEGIGRSTQEILAAFDVETPIDLATYGAHINTIQNMVQELRAGKMPDLALLGSSIGHVLKDAGIKSPVDLALIGKNFKVISNIVECIKHGKNIDISDLGAALHHTLTSLNIDTGMNLETIAQRVENAVWLAQGVIQGTKTATEFISTIGTTLKEAGTYLPTVEGVKATIKNGMNYLFGAPEVESAATEGAKAPTSPAAEPGIAEPNKTNEVDMQRLQRDTTPISQPTAKTSNRAGVYQSGSMPFN